jgi:hypothetical protein
MILVGVHAARRDQADQMAGAAGAAQALDQAEQRGGPRNLTRIHSLIDARQILHHDATGADIEVPDLGISHLAVG